MRIALINENSQAAKNALVERCLREVAEPLGHVVDNYGMYTAEDECQLTYVMAGLLTGILINSGAADFVVTGCGTGEGAMLASNIYPNVLCGHIADVEDAFMFAQINNGNAIAFPFAKKFGWGGELTLTYAFEKLFSKPFGGGYPPERAEPEQRNKLILDQVKAVTTKDMLTILKEIDQEFLKKTISGKKFDELFYPNCKDEAIAAYLRGLK